MLSKKNWIKYIRVTIGLSQKQLADFFGTSRVYVSYLETDKKEPSQAVIKKVMFLHEVIVKHQLSADDDVRPQISQSEIEAITKNLTGREQLCTLTTQRLSRKLEKMQRVYKECGRSGTNFPLLTQNLTDEQHKKMYELLFSVFEDDNRVKMKACDLNEQISLQLRIAALAAEAAEIKNIQASLQTLNQAAAPSP